MTSSQETKETRCTQWRVFVGSAGHLARFKVLDAQGKFVPGGLFRTMAEAEAFIATLNS